MDDLLALFEENPPEEPQAPTLDSDDETAVVGDAARSATETTLICRGVVEQGKATKSRHNDTQQQKKSLNNHHHNHVACTVDSRVDIRMKNRKISSIDLLDMISSNNPPYHSPASLAAMSLAQLNKLLVEPAVAVVDMATVHGKTNIMTVGIVFSNSATRIAASGNAFCILTIGTLRTGPAVSLLLFGGAYGQHVKQCKPGMVIAVFSPKLVPPKAGDSSSSRGSSSHSDTAITFTLNDARQISLLAESEDYATCQGRVRGKNEAGAWVSDAKPCRTVVDKRVCLYCPLHRCQKINVNKSNSDPSSTKGTIKMQALRLESTSMTASNSERRMILPQQNSIPYHQMKNHEALRGNKPPLSENMLSEFRARQSGHGLLSSTSLTLTSVSQNRLLSAASNHHQRPVPAGPHGSVVGKSTLPGHQQAQKNNSILNPYSKKQVTPNNSTAMGGRMMGHTITMKQRVVKQQKQMSTQGGSKIADSKLQDLQNILQPPMKRCSMSSSSTTAASKASKRPRKTINTVSLEGFNGSVVVPKPKPIFAASNAGSIGGRHSTTTSSRTQQQLQHQHEAAVQASIRAKQQQMAARLREKQQGISKQSRNKQMEQNRTVAARDSLFGTPLDDAQREQLLEAKSQFADEAKSEEYARSRKVVVELEKQEEKKNNQSGNNDKNKNKNAKNGSSQAIIQKQWHCRTCGKSYPKRPRICEQANHRVVLCREIQKQKSTAETRFDLSNKDACDGGLKLGSGIEWSYSRFS